LISRGRKNPKRSDTDSRPGSPDIPYHSSHGKSILPSTVCPHN